MNIAFCPKCNQKVMPKREDMDLCLLIILSIFTGGIGGIIYLIIYYNRNPNRCSYCNNICIPLKSEELPVSSSRDCETSKSTTINDNKDNLIVQQKICFCSNCGVKLIIYNEEKLNYCPYCGEFLSERLTNYRTMIKCTICHQNIEKSDKTIVCSFCGSSYHYSCVSNWLTEHNSCPLCQNRFLNPAVKITPN